MEHIAENWRFLQDRIAAAAQRSGRDPDAVEVIAVTKTRTPAEVEAALACGLLQLGENRVQEAEGKIGRIAAETTPRWHLIGRLQSNKAGKAVALFDAVQSVDSLDLACRLDRRAGLSGRRLEVMVQVNTAAADGQGGVAPEAVAELVGQIAELPHLQPSGLMTIAAHSADEGRVRACFGQLRDLRQTVGAAGTPLTHLSMGMSGDFVWAVEEGATMLRLGTALFGPRPT